MALDFSTRVLDIDNGCVAFRFGSFGNTIGTGEMKSTVIKFMEHKGHIYPDDYTINTAPWKLGQPTGLGSIAVYFKDPENFVMFKLQNTGG